MSEYCCARPAGISAADVPEPVREKKDGEQVITVNDQFTVILEPLSEPIDNELYFNVYVHNKTDSAVAFILTDFYVNGKLNELFSSFDYIRPGMHCCSRVAIEPYKFAAGDISELERLGLTILICRTENIPENILFTQTLTDIL